MSDSPNSWPLDALPGEDSRVILATQGVRLWTAVCHVLSFEGGVLRLSCSDSTTVENLRCQARVAFSILDHRSASAIQGSGIAHLAEQTDVGCVRILLEPYRICTGPEQTYELRLNGWMKVADGPPPAVTTFGFWYQAFRGVTLTLAALPILLGAAAAFAQGRVDPLLLILALVGGLAAHAGANATADYFDFRNGVDLSGALSSHLGALARERVEPELILLAAFACFSVTAMIGIVLVQIVGWQLLLFGLVGLLGAFFYTGWPVSYKYRAMGELLLGILMGPTMVMGSYFLHTRGWDWGVFLLSLALAVLISSVSLVNNLRDLPDDRAAGIRTLPMALGVSRTKKLYYVLTAGPYVFALGSILVDPTFWPVAIVAASLPRAVTAIQMLRDTADDVQDIRQKALKRPFPLYSIRLHLRFGTLAVVGLVLAGLISPFLGG